MDTSLQQPQVNVEEVPEDDPEQQEDVFQDPERDPWGVATGRRERPISMATDGSISQSSGTGAASPGQTERRRGMGQGHMPQYTLAFAQVSLPVQDGGTVQCIIHDVPPVWDGKDPNNQAEPYLKLLS